MIGFPVVGKDISNPNNLFSSFMGLELRGRGIGVWDCPTLLVRWRRAEYEAVSYLVMKVGLINLYL